MNADKDGDDEEPATAARDKAITDEATAMKDNAIDKTTSSDSLKTRKLPPWLLATKSDVTKEEHKKKVTKTATAAVAAKRPKPPETAPASKVMAYTLSLMWPNHLLQHTHTHTQK